MTAGIKHFQNLHQALRRGSGGELCKQLSALVQPGFGTCVLAPPSSQAPPLADYDVMPSQSATPSAALQWDVPALACRTGEEPKGVGSALPRRPAANCFSLCGLPTRPRARLRIQDLETGPHALAAAALASSKAPFSGRQPRASSGSRLPGPPDAAGPEEPGVDAGPDISSRRVQEPRTRAAFSPGRRERCRARWAKPASQECPSFLF